MKFVYTTGCTCDGITINEKDVEDFSKEDLKEYVDHMVSQLTNEIEKDDMIDLIREIVERFGEYKYLYHCEQCGDNVCEYKLEF